MPFQPRVHTVYFGGGTPTILGNEHFSRILSAIRRAMRLEDGAEITVEGNPGTISLEKLAGLKQSGVNRLSMGMQSARADELQLLGRIHSHQTTVETVRMAKEAGFDNISVDLIFGLPGQTLADWKETLEEAIRLRTTHLSLYALTIEEGTVLDRRISKDEISAPDPDTAAEMYEWTMDRMAAVGFEQYEISNWAKLEKGKDWRSRHNLQYWIGEPYFGFGAGAHAFLAGKRVANLAKPDDYIRACVHNELNQYPLGPASLEPEDDGPEAMMDDWMILGLRMTREGVSRAKFRERFDEDFLAVYQPEILKLLKLELIEWMDEEQDRLRLTRRGRMLGNQVFMEFLRI